MYNIIAITGKSAAGKDRILREIAKTNNKNINIIVPTTSRPMRDYEVDGKDYHFIDEKEFFKKRATESFVECTTHRDWFYGVEFQNLHPYKINVGAFNPIAIKQLAEREDVQLTIFKVEAKDKTRLLRQLNRENDPDCQEIVRRYSSDRLDFSLFDYNYPNIKIENETEEDLIAALGIILQKVEELAIPGQK
jgi:guanylate kinase